MSNSKRSRPQPAALRESLRSTVKELTWQAVRYEPGRRPTICLFCTRRGGSTWLMETIAANHGILPLNQPMDLLTPNLTPYQFRRLPKFDHGQVIHPEADQESELRAYTDDLMAGRIRVNAPHRFWTRDFRFRTDRLLLKIVSAKPMMDWFDRTYDVDIAYLVRHPIPQALSCIRNDWGTTTMAYVRNEWFVDEVIQDSGLRGFAEKLDRDGSPLARMVVNWVMENLYPLRALPDRPHWLSLSYEEFAADRETVLTTISDRLELDDVSGMLRASSMASRSSGLSSAESMSSIRAGDRHAQVTKWTERVTSRDLADVAEILDRFEIDLYTPHSPWPNWSSYRPS